MTDKDQSGHNVGPTNLPHCRQMKLKISVIDETKLEEILLNQKFGTKKNFFQYCELWLKFWMKFAQLSSIFHGTIKS